MFNHEKSPLSIRHRKDIPLFFPGEISNETKGTILAADVGGTKTNLAVFEVSGGEMRSLFLKSYLTKDYSSFSEVYHLLGEETLPKIDVICLGVAGPVINGKVDGTNFTWHLDQELMTKEFGVKEVYIINDMEANAYGLAALEKKDFFNVQEGLPMDGNAVIISPGTGLGEVGLFWDGKTFHPFPSEGGHCDFSPRQDLDVELWRYLHKKYGHVSWERILSGPGIVDLYYFLYDYRQPDGPDPVRHEAGKIDPAILITGYAKDGSSEVCKETVALFVRFLAIEAAQLALKAKAVGGIYIGGGILPKNLESLNAEVFRENFIASGRMNSFLKDIPINVILNDKTALYGAGLLAASALNIR